MTDTKPVTVPRIALGVAFGLLAVIALLWAIWEFQQPSTLDCADQLIAESRGERGAVEDGCR